MILFFLTPRILPPRTMFPEIFRTLTYENSRKDAYDHPAHQTEKQFVADRRPPPLHLALPPLLRTPEPALVPDDPFATPLYSATIGRRLTRGAIRQAWKARASVVGVAAMGSPASQVLSEASYKAYMLPSPFSSPAHHVRIAGPHRVSQASSLASSTNKPLPRRPIGLPAHPKAVVFGLPAHPAVAVRASGSLAAYVTKPKLPVDMGCAEAARHPAPEVSAAPAAALATAPTTAPTAARATPGVPEVSTFSAATDGSPPATASSAATFVGSPGLLSPMTLKKQLGWLVISPTTPDTKAKGNKWLGVSPPASAASSAPSSASPLSGALFEMVSGLDDAIAKMKEQNA
jgi:hypothetical protein